MDLQSRPLRYFLAVARERSFSRAAQRLHVSQPALSAQMRELERVLDFQLFERTSRQVTLTREGRLFLRDAQRMVAQSERLLRAAEEIRRTDLRIGTAIYTALIPERVRLLTQFYKSYPDVRVRVSNLFQVDQFRRLRQGDLDIAISVGLSPTSAALASELDSEIMFPADLERLPLTRRRVGLTIPVNDDLAGRPDLTLDDLKGRRIVMIGDFHGSELIHRISLPLLEAGVDLVDPPEGNAIAVEQYGAVMGLPAVSLGWFAYGEERPKRIHQIGGLDVSTELVMLRAHSSEHRTAALALWQFAASSALSESEEVSLHGEDAKTSSAE